MEIQEPLAGELTRRLRRIEGQVRGLQAMISDGRDCRSIVTQVSAASKALDQVGFKLLAAGLTSCLTHPEDAEYSLQEVEQMFLKLS
jgi:DNA-binding FrmR family transcriptional regulator